MELEYEVTSRSALIAAVKAAACRTHEEARANPVTIKNGTTTYRFKEGIQETRGHKIISKIKRTSEKAFNVVN